MHARPIFASFTSGEMSPLLFGRVDFAKYTAGLRIVLNYLIRPHGPLYRRPGTRFITEVKDSTKFCRMIKFEFSTTQAYQLELGDQYMRFYKDGGRIQLTITGAVNNGGGAIRLTSNAHGLITGMRVVVSGVGGVPNATGTWTVAVITANTFDLTGSTFAGAYTSGGIAIPDIATPFTSAELPFVKKIQSADTAYFFHPSHPIQKLVRYSHTAWTLSAANFLPPPTYEAGIANGVTATPAATTGLGVNVVAGGPAFEDADVGRMITTDAAYGVNGNPARAIITALGGPAPNATAVCDIVDNFASTGAIPSGSWIVQGSPNTAATPGAAQPAHAVMTITLAARGFRAGDVGAYVRINKGACRILAVPDATHATVEILSPLDGVTAAPGGAWSIEIPIWSAQRGYPAAGAFHEQRMVAAGNASNPQTFWGSNVGQYEVFALGPDDDDAYEFTIAANDVNVINAVLPLAWMLVFTAAAEFKIKGSDGATNAAISPNSVDVRPSTFWGSSARVAPLRIGNVGLFVSRAGTELREMVFEIARDNYIANDLLLLAEHLTVGGGYTILDMDYQRRPNSTVWCIRSDGALLALTYQRDHDVAGWSRHLTGETALRDDGVDADHNALTTEIPDRGMFESVCVTPHWAGDRDVAFFIVKRTVNGATKRYVEYMDELGGYYGALGVDSGQIYSGVATRSVSGLDHLEGEEVTILANGAVYPSQVVSGGVVTVANELPAFTQAEIGLGFTSVMETMQPEIPQQGTSQGLSKLWSSVYVRLYKSQGLVVNGVVQDFRTPDDPMDAALPLFSGDKLVSNPVDLGPSGTIRIEQRDPLPQTVIAIFGPVTVGDVG